MNKYITLGCLSALLYTSTSLAEFRADLTTKTVSYTTPIYVSRSAPILTELATIDLGSMYAWTWWNTTGAVRPGIYLPGSLSASSPKVGGAYVKELGSSGIGYTLHGTISGGCSGSAYVDGQQNIDGNYSNRLICSSLLSRSNYSVSLKMTLYKLRDNVKSQTIPNTWVAMLILYNNGFITRDYYGNIEPKINLAPLTIISSGCDVVNNNINVPMGSVAKSSFNGVGSVSPDSINGFSIDLSCDPVSPIKIRFDGATDNQAAGTIVLNNANDTNTAKGYGIQVKYQNQPIKLGQLMTISERNNSAGHYSIPLEAGYIQTSDTTKAGKADGTLQFTMQYH
ncbi:fimbrial protein [Proteus hauseri]|uniref:fimbrial protein n=1 Tax=Proteus hauseri TaxID=183417 RepID=UPI0032DA27AE